MKKIVLILIAAGFFVGCKSGNTASSSNIQNNQGINFQTDFGNINISGNTKNVSIRMEGNNVSIDTSKGKLILSPNGNGVSITDQNNSGNISYSMNGKNIDINIQ